MSYKFKPIDKVPDNIVQGRVVVIRDVPFVTEKIEVPLHIYDSEHRKITQGIIVEASDACQSVGAGDHILFGSYAGMHVKVRDNSFKGGTIGYDLMMENDIIAIIEEDEGEQGKKVAEVFNNA